MNHVYRVIWNKSLGVWQAVGEIGKGLGKGKSDKRRKRASLAGIAAASLLFVSVQSHANVVIDGNLGSGYFVESGTLTLENKTLQNFSTIGGSGSGSGGGAGLGGAIFINEGAVVHLNNVDFVGNTVTGGTGGSGSIGGSLNGISSGPTPGAAGDNGRDAPPAFAFANGGNGGVGYNALHGADATNGVGGNGGKGGNGSEGLPVTADTVMAIAQGIFDAAMITWDAASLIKDGTMAGTYTNIALQFTQAAAYANTQVMGGLGAGYVVSELGIPFAALAAQYTLMAAEEGAVSTSHDMLRLAADTAMLAANTAYATAMHVTGLQIGTMGVGGDGGTGGDAGSGSDFYGGGKGGNGGNGGNAYIDSGAFSGAGGDGGAGGAGGFGAGGGEGGYGGTAGAVSDGTSEWGGNVSPDGGAGSGGVGGFGAGSGANGSDGGGAGGSGFGGAIFVRKGGTLVMTGNALFDQNAAFGGDGQQDSETALAGDTGIALGTDLFMMKGSQVILAPGQGNVITFNGSIADDSEMYGVAAGKGASLTVQGGGLVVFNGENSYTGQTVIGTNGVLQAQDGVGIATNSNINLAGGVLQTSGEFTRFTGTSSSRIQWTGSGGFAAADADGDKVNDTALTVTLNNGNGLTWGQSGFIANGNALIFGSDTATDNVTFTNAMNLNNGVGTILVVDNSDSINNVDKANRAILTGVISNGSLVVGDATHTGIAKFTAANTYAGGTTINGGTMELTDSGSLNADGSMTVNAAGTLDISGTGNQTMGVLSGAGTVNLGKNTLTLNQTATSTFSGTLNDGGISGGTGAGVTLQGGGDLTLSGTNTYTGTTNVLSATTLNLTGSLASSAVNVSSTSTLNDTNAGLAANAAVSNDGTLNLGASDTVASLVNTGTINGTGHTLTAATYALNNGSVVNANLGTGVVTANGSVALNGTSAAATVNVETGTTTLGSTERLLDTAAVTVNALAHLVLGGNEKIGSLTGAGNVNLDAGKITVDSGNFSGVLHGTNGLDKVSTGELVLSGENTYTGTTNVNAGMLTLDGSLISPIVNVASGSTLNDNHSGLASNTALTNAGTIYMGADDTVASLVNTGTINGTGSTLTAATYALNNGSVVNANLGTGIVTANGSVALNGTSSAEIVNVVTGTTTLGSAERLLDTSVVTVTSNLVLGGAEKISQLFGAGNVDLNAGTMTVDSGNFSGVMHGTNGLNKVTTGELVLSGANTYTGTTNVNAGTLTLTGSLASEAVNVSVDSILNDTNAGLAANAAVTNNGTLNLGASDVVASLVNTGTINGTGHTLTAATYALNNGSVVNANLGTGVVTANGTVALNGTSAAATVNVETGTTTLGSAERLLDTAAVTVNSLAHLVLGGNEKIGSLAGAGNVNLNAGTMTVDSGNFSGVLHGTHGLDKVSTGELVLSGANTYTGTTNVNAGTLTLNGSLVSPVVNVASGSTLNNNQGGLAENSALTNAGTINMGADNTVASLVNNGGEINGTGKTLTAATYALNDGSLVDANLGTGTITTGVGIVVLKGTTNANRINVVTGSILNLGVVGTGDTTTRLLNSQVAVDVNGIINMNGGNEHIKTLTGAGVINLTTNQLNVDNGGEFTGTINGQNSLLNANGGTLKLAGGSDATTLSTTVSNNGSLEISGNSTVTTKEASITDGGTLNIASGSTFDATADGGTGLINVGTGSNVILASDANLDYVKLTGGSSTQSGGTIVADEFTNKVDSSVAGFLTFTGNFTNNGTLSPGNSPGTTTILGSYTENATFVAEVENTLAGGYDQVRVGGTVTLNPASVLSVQPWNAAVPVRGDVYQIIADTNGDAHTGITGTFGNVLYGTNTTPNAAVVFDVGTGKLLATGLNASNSVFADLGATTSQRAAANALMTAATNPVGVAQINSTTATGSSASALITANGSSASANAERLVPEQYAGLANYGLLSGKVIADLVQSRATGTARRDASQGSTADGVSVYAGYMNNRDNTSPGKVNSNDFYVGAEKAGEKATVGFVAMSNNGGISSTFGRGDVTGQSVALYAHSAVTPKVTLSGSVGYSTQDFTMNRSSVTGSAHGETSSSGMNYSLGASYLAYDEADVTVTPRINVSHAETSVKGFTETGSSAQRLALAGYNADRTVLQTGVLVSRNLNLDSGNKLKLGVAVGVDSPIGDKKGDMNATMVTSPDVKFPISFDKYNDASGTLGLSANYEVSKTASIYAKVDHNTSLGDSARVEFSKSF